MMYNPYSMLPPDPRQMRLAQDRQLFSQYYGSNPAAAFSILMAGGGDQLALGKWVAQNYFGGDENAYRNWVNQNGQTRQLFSYDPTTGGIHQADVGRINPNYTSPFSQYNAGQQQGQTQQTAQVNNPYAGMTTLYRDNQGMLHDPGNNPIPATPTQPQAPNPYGGYGYPNPYQQQGGIMRQLGLRGRNNNNNRNDPGPNPITKPGSNVYNFTRTTNGTTTPPVTTTTPTTPPGTRPPLDNGNVYLNGNPDYLANQQ